MIGAERLRDFRQMIQRFSVSLCVFTSLNDLYVVCYDMIDRYINVI